MKRMKPTELLSMDTPSVECEIPQYDCLQDAKTDLVLDQLVEMIHEIKGEIAELREIMTGKGGCNQGAEGLHRTHGRYQEEYPLTNPEHTARFS